MASGADRPTPEQPHVFETPENVRLAFRLAGPGTRLGAYGIDLVIRIAIFYAVAYVVTRAQPFTGTSLTTGVFFVLAVCSRVGLRRVFSKPGGTARHRESGRSA